MKKSLSKRLAAVLATTVIFACTSYQYAYAKEKTNTVKTEQKTAGKSDTQPPTLDYNSLKINKKTFKPGDTVKISFKLKDDISGVDKNSVYVTYKKPEKDGVEARQTILLRYNSNNDCFEGTIEIYEGITPGKWTIWSIQAKDHLNNETFYNNDDGKLDILSFEVVNSNSHLQSTGIDLNSLSIDKKNVKPTDSIKIRCKSNIDEKDLSKADKDYLSKSSVTIRYTKPMNQDTHCITLHYNSDTGYFEGKLYIYEYIQNGTWIPYEVSFDDPYMGPTYYNNKNGELNALSFTVTGSDSDIQPPKVDLKSLKIDKKDVTIGGTVNFSFKASDDKIGLSNAADIWFIGYKYPVNLYLDSEDGCYKGSLKIINGMKEGHWTPDYLWLNDTAGNRALVKNVNNILDDLSFNVHYENNMPAINAEDKTIKVGDKFDPLAGVTASDKEDGDLTNKIEIAENTVDTTKSGEYKVVYRVTDSYGSSSTKEIKVTVEKKPAVVNPGNPSQEPVKKPAEENTNKSANSCSNKEEVKTASTLPKTGGFGSGILAVSALSSIISGVYIGRKKRK